MCNDPLQLAVPGFMVFSREVTIDVREVLKYIARASRRR